MTSAAYIAAKLAGGKVIASGGNYLVRCPAHRDATPSLSLRDGEHGLQVHCFAGCRAGDVYAAIRRKVGELLKPGTIAPEPVKGSSEYERRQHDKAGWLWSQRRPIAGTVAERYLCEARGYSGPLPSTLGFLPPRKQHPPAMIAAFGIAEEPEPSCPLAPRHVGAVHITHLRDDGVGKANIEPNKIVIGSPGALPFVLAPCTDLLGLAVAEGIEDALSVHQATGLGAWAAGSAGFMPKLASAVPRYVEAVTIFAHNDPAGRDGAQRLAVALRERGIATTVEGL